MNCLKCVTDTSDMACDLANSLPSLRMAACQDRESSVNDHFGELLIFCSTIPFGKLFSKIKFKSSDDY